MFAVRDVVDIVRSAARPSGGTTSARSEGLAFDLQRLFPDGAPTIFDVGGYVGEFAALVHEVFPQARVFSFEPFPDSYDRITNRFRKAGWLTVENIGLSNAAGSADLIIGEDGSTNSIVSAVVTKGSYDASRPRVSIRLDTLSNRARALLRDDPRISILKVDTEGNDLKVLQGGENLLHRGAIEAVHVEVMFMEHFKGAPGFVEICAYLQRFDYRLFSLYDLKRNAHGQLRFGNAVFLSPHRQTFAGVAR